MKSDKYNRKKFITTIASATAGGILFNTMLPVSSAAQNKSFFYGQPKNEYLFSEGLIYLNTGTLGPCRRNTLDESLKVWKDLESLPVKFYGKFGAEELAEKTRGIAAISGL